MQFQVPQFIETEDKIVGPLTLRQFLYIGAAGLLSFLLFFVLKIWLWFMITAVFGTLASALAFIKYNGRPMHVIILSALKYLWQPRFYLWKRTEPSFAPPSPKAADGHGEATKGREKMVRPGSPQVKIPEIKIDAEKTPLLKALWLKIQTGAQSIKPPSPASILHKFHKEKEKFEILRKLTGEREKARRIDYR